MRTKSALYLVIVICILFTGILSGCQTTAVVREDETDVIIIKPTDDDSNVYIVKPTETQKYVVDSDIEIKEFIRNYYDLWIEGECELAAYMTNDGTKLDREEFAVSGEYVDSIKSLNCFIEEGLVANTYIVVAKLGLVTTYGDDLIYRLEAFYVCKNESGTYYISGTGIGDEARSYNSIMLSDSKILELVATTKQENELAVASNSQLMNLFGVVFSDDLFRFLYEKPQPERE